MVDDGHRSEPTIPRGHEKVSLSRSTLDWPWLLLPIILTTAFVIFGAWKREVRDAEVRAVDADE